MHNHKTERKSRITLPEIVSGTMVLIVLCVANGNSVHKVITHYYLGR